MIRVGRDWDPGEGAWQRHVTPRIHAKTIEADNGGDGIGMLIVGHLENTKQKGIEPLEQPGEYEGANERV